MQEQIITHILISGGLSVQLGLFLQAWSRLSKLTSAAAAAVHDSFPISDDISAFIPRPAASFFKKRPKCTYCNTQPIHICTTSSVPFRKSQFLKKETNLERVLNLIRNLPEAVESQRRLMRQAIRWAADGRFLPATVPHQETGASHRNMNELKKKTEASQANGRSGSSRKQ